MGRHHTTIGREIKRNGGQHYIAINAKLQAGRRKKQANQTNPRKSDRLMVKVEELLQRGWSPEQIAGQLGKVHGEKVISHECIYQYIYEEENKGQALWEYLPRKQKRRRKKGGRKAQRIRIPDRVSIDARPKRVNNRKVFGHWEGDTVIGKGKDHGLHTEVERQSRYLQAEKVSDLTARQTLKAQLRMFKGLPIQARQSTTLDNGLEFVEHIQLRSKLSMETYFSDPYAAWQRGCNEYHNGLLRRYLPKGTSFKDLTDKELSDIVAEINDRPRKCLGYNTPREVFESNL